MGGLGLAGLLIGNNVRASPWILGLLWAAAWASTSAGLRWLLPSKTIRWVLAIAMLVVAYNLWHSTADRAQVRVIGINVLEKDPSAVKVNVSVENVGNYPARLRINARATGMTAPSQFAAQQTTYRLFDRLAAVYGDKWTETAELKPGESMFFTVSYPLSDAASEAMKRGALQVGIAGILAYRDWWVRFRRTRFCYVVTRPQTPQAGIPYCSSFNDET